MDTIDRAKQIARDDEKFCAAIVRAIDRGMACGRLYFWAIATGEIGWADTSATAARDADRAAEAWTPRVLRASGLVVDLLP